MTLGYILLGLLIDKPMTGYDLKTFFKNSVNFFWSAELSQIYRELSKLEKQGYLESRIEQQEGKPNKKLYYINKEGERIFLEWLQKFPGSLGSQSKNEFLVRLFFSSRLSHEELVIHFEKYIGEMEEELAIYRTIEAGLDMKLTDSSCSTDAFYHRLTVRRGIHYAQSEIKWANESIEAIRAIKTVNG